MTAYHLSVTFDPWRVLLMSGAGWTLTLIGVVTLDAHIAHFWAICAELQLYVIFFLFLFC